MNLCTYCKGGHDCAEEKREAAYKSETAEKIKKNEAEEEKDKDTLAETHPEVVATVTMTQTAHSEPSRRRMTDLDDPEGRNQSEQMHDDETDFIDFIDTGPPQEPLEEWYNDQEELHEEAHETGKRRRITGNTAEDQAHKHYQRKRKFDYESVKVHLRGVRKAQKAEYAEHIRKISNKNASKPQRLIEEEVEENEEIENEGNKSESAWSKIHTNHKRNIVAGIVYCRRCGCFCINKAIGLAKVCQGKPAHNAAKPQLKKLDSGRHPVPGAQEWPDGSSSASRFKPTAIDRY